MPDNYSLGISQRDPRLVLRRIRTDSVLIYMHVHTVVSGFCIHTDGVQAVAWGTAQQVFVGCDVSRAIGTTTMPPQQEERLTQSSCCCHTLQWW